MKKFTLARLRCGIVLATLGVSATAGTLAPTAAAPDLRCTPNVATKIPQPTQAQLAAAGLGNVPLAPLGARRDLIAAPFTRGTNVTNPLFPISQLHSAILNGAVDGKIFHTETTLLPFTQIIETSPGQCARVLVSQYMAFLDGRLEETAIDLYAQSDDGSVWYLGESVFDYDEAGLIVTTDGTWHAGIEGPAAMIMPATPKIGDAFRPENIPGTVFEEVRVTKTNQTYVGPSGRISGVLVGLETHQDGSFSEKVFAPGYGEFLSTTGKNFEAMALASPIDRVAGGTPEDLSDILDSSEQIFASRLQSIKEWARAKLLALEIAEDWSELRVTNMPPRLIEPMDLAVRELLARVTARNRRGTLSASIALSFAANDLTLRYRSVPAVDTMRFDLWVRRALLDAASGSIDGVRSDVVTLEWIRDRIAHTLDPVTLTEVDTLVRDLGGSVRDDDLGSATQIARDLRAVLSDLL